MNKPTVTAFRWVPAFAQGLVRDLRVRWALEEAGREYEAQLIGPAEQKSDGYRSLQPFGQVPAYEEDGLTLFESGAIVMHIAEKSEALLPVDPDARARVRTWMFAALNTVEPPIMMLHVIDRPSGAGEVRAQVLQAIQTRLDSLAAFLGERHYLVTDRFTAADLLMITVLRALRTTDLIGKTPALQAYCLRGEARPAFQRALAAQLAPFVQHAPKPVSA